MKRVALLALLGCLVMAPAAHAAYPWQNGRIALDRGGAIWSMDPRLTVRLTDTERRFHGGNDIDSTASDFPLALVTSCVPTASTLDASTCQLATTVEALLPGAVKETERASSCPERAYPRRQC